jgi:hypothetical protein
VTAAKAKLLVARETFAAEVDGQERIFHAGVTRLRANHPAVKGREHLFEPLAEHRERPDIEAATKAPAKKRGTRKR